MKQFKGNLDKTDQIHNGRKCVMLAHGESGHAHAFYGEDTVEFDGRELKVKATDELAHEEHTKIVIDPGIGEVDYQREYRMGSLRRVVD